MKAIDLHTHSIYSDGSLTVEELVDLAIEKNALLMFYGHAQSSYIGYFTEENVRSLLMYIKEKLANYECTIKTPFEAVKDFYSVRADDVM